MPVSFSSQDSSSESSVYVRLFLGEQLVERLGVLFAFQRVAGARGPAVRGGEPAVERVIARVAVQGVVRVEDLVVLRSWDSVLAGVSHRGPPYRARPAVTG